MLAVQIAFALVFSLLLVVEPVQGQGLEKPILMDRREVGALGDIVTELKGKSMGGRMRFGKRAMMHQYPPRPHYLEEEDILY